MPLECKKPEDGGKGGTVEVQLTVKLWADSSKATAFDDLVVNFRKDCAAPSPLPSICSAASTHQWNEQETEWWFPTATRTQAAATVKFASYNIVSREVRR